MADSRDLVEPPASLKSPVWRHFSFEKKDGIVEKANTVCKLCSDNVSYKSGTTTNMMHHLKRKHNIEIKIPVTKTVISPQPAVKDPSNSSPTGQLRVPEMFKMKSKYGKSSDRHQSITRAIGVFMAKDMRPYSIVENKGFRSMVHELDPRYDIPCRTHFSEKVIPNLYQEAKDFIVKKLQAAPFVALTSDSWTSRATQSYNTMTAHFIDVNWEINNYVLETTVMTESHTAENISNFLTYSILKWDLKRNGQNPSLTTDNAANVVNAAKLAELTHVRCFAHTINLASQRGLRVQQMDRLLGRIRRIVSFFHRSTTATAIFKAKQGLLSLPSQKLVNDVPTRWNSSFDMIERYLEQQSAIEATLLTREVKRNTKDVHLLSEDDVTSAEQVMKVLGPLKTITTVLSDSKSPTLSMIHPLKEQMLISLQANGNDSTLIKNVKAAIRDDLKPRYTDPQVLQFLYESSCLDPRFKSMPYLSAEERSDVFNTLNAKTIKLNEHSDVPVQVKTEKPETPVTPLLPTLPEIETVEPSTSLATATETQTVKVEDEPPNKKTKSALDDLFGDVFVTKVEPGHSLETRVDNEIMSYKSESNMPLISNPLEWWKVRENTYPLLCKVAKMYLSIPATSVASERVFSTAGDIVTAQRSCLLPEQVDYLIFLKKNLIL